MTFIYKTSKFTPVWTTVLKIRAIYVHQTSTVFALLGPVYTIADHLRIGSLFISDWGCVCTALHESDTLCSNNPVQPCSTSASGTKVDPVQSIPFCFTCKHCYPVRNAPRPSLDNRMASIQMRLIDYLTSRQRK